MRSKASIPELLELVRKREEDFYDETISVSDICFNSLEEVSIGPSAYSLQRQAKTLISQRLQIPLAYLERCPEEIQAINLNYWLKKQPNRKLFARFDREEVRAIFTTKYRPVANSTILETLIRSGMNGTAHYAIDNTLMLLNIPDEKSSFRINGDMHQPGISILNSEVGLYAVTISAFILRLVCTNGMISEVKEDKRYRHISKRIAEELPPVITQVSEQMRITSQKLAISLDSPVDDPMSTFNSFNYRFKLTKEEAEAVGRSWPLEAGNNIYSIINTYTRAARDEFISPESSLKLQRVGGAILNLVPAGSKQGLVGRT